MDPGGLLKNSQKVDERGRMQRFMIERGNPLCKTSDERLSPIKYCSVVLYFVAIGKFTADGGLL